MTTPAQRLQSEIETDPLGRGYAGMTNTQVAEDLKTAYRASQRTTLDAAEIFEAIDRTEFASKLPAEQARIDRILSLGGAVQVGPGTKARDEIVAIFGGGSATIANLLAIANITITRAAELDLGEVTQWSVNDARNP